MTNPSKSNGQVAGQYRGEVEMHETHCCVVMQQPASANSSNGGASTSQLYCMTQLMRRTPATFSCSLKLSAESSGVELVIQNALLHKLPYFASLQKQKFEQSGHKKSTKGATSYKVAFNPPCPTWGLVSLLLLIEKQVQPDRWFGDKDSDPALATHTLQVRSKHLRKQVLDRQKMAEMLGCKEEKHAICEWLLSAAQCISQYKDAQTDKVSRNSASCEPASKRPRGLFTAQHGHLKRAIQALPASMCKVVVDSLSESQTRSACAEVAAKLPFSLQRIWIASFWPVMDLRAAKLTSLQWIQILSITMALEELVGHSKEGVPTQHLKSLRMSMPFDIKEGVRFAVSGKWRYRKCPTHTLDKHLAHCVKCNTSREANSPIQIVGRCTHPLASISNVSLADTCPCHDVETTAVKVSRDQLYTVLVGLEGATSVLKLKQLALHDFVVPPQFVSLLEDIFLNLSGSLTELYFEHAGSNSLEPTWEYQSADKTALFRAISMLENLQVLTIVFWEEFVGTDTDSVLPLLELQHLQTVFVNEVKDTPAFACGLNFAPLIQAPAANAVANHSNTMTSQASNAN